MRPLKAVALTGGRVELESGRRVSVHKRYRPGTKLLVCWDFTHDCPSSVIEDTGENMEDIEGLEFEG